MHTSMNLTPALVVDPHLLRHLGMIVELFRNPQKVMKKLPMPSHIPGKIHNNSDSP